LSKILLTKKINAIFLTIVLIAGAFAISSPLTVYGQQYQQDYSLNYQQDYDSSYYHSSHPRMHDNHSAKPNQKANCDNENVNVNDLSQVQRQEQAIGNNVDDAAVDEATLDGQQLTPEEEALNAITGNGDGGSKSLLNIERNIVNICINSNDNTLTGTFTSTQTQTPPTPPTPPPTPPITASLTVKKQVFGCDDIFEFPNFIDMVCSFPNNSPEWLDCNNSSITNSIFCQSLPENIFDIKVLDDQSTLIQEFEGSEQGTTIQNLEPGTYTVNEIKHLTNDNQLGESPFAERECTSVSAGFSDEGSLVNSNSLTTYSQICFEYEDEQDNDCSTITLAAGEERTCIVKNYIRIASDFI
jgi:hypothetical protein